MPKTRPYVASTGWKFKPDPQSLALHPIGAWYNWIVPSSSGE